LIKSQVKVVAKNVTFEQHHPRKTVIFCHFLPLTVENVLYLHAAAFCEELYEVKKDL
jgi:hypothetical protein